MTENSEKIDESASSSQVMLDQFKTTLNEMIHNIEVIKTYNTTIGEEMFVNVAKLDHMMFKTNAYSSVFEGSVQEDSKDYKSCNFGKWYYEEGANTFNNQKGYKAIEASHKLVHTSIQNALKMMSEQDVNHEEVLKLFQNSEEASKELFVLLNSLVEQK